MGIFGNMLAGMGSIADDPTAMSAIGNLGAAVAPEDPTVQGINNAAQMTIAAQNKKKLLQALLSGQDASALAGAGTTQPQQQSAQSDPATLANNRAAQWFKSMLGGTPPGTKISMDEKGANIKMPNPNLGQGQGQGGNLNFPQAL